MTDEHASASEGRSMTGPLGGLIRPMYMALATPEDGPLLRALVVPDDPSVDRIDDTINGVDWHSYYVPRLATTFMCKAGTVFGITMTVDADDDGDVYPAPDKLIEGLPLPAAPEQVRAHLGEPAAQSEEEGVEMDWFGVGDHVLRVSYGNGRTTEISLFNNN